MAQCLFTGWSLVDLAILYCLPGAAAQALHTDCALGRVREKEWSHLSACPLSLLVRDVWPQACARLSAQCACRSQLCRIQHWTCARGRIERNGTVEVVIRRRSHCNPGAWRTAQRDEVWSTRRAQRRVRLPRRPHTWWVRLPAWTQLPLPRVPRWATCALCACGCCSRRVYVLSQNQSATTLNPVHRRSN